MCAGEYPVFTWYASPWFAYSSHIVILLSQWRYAQRGLFTMTCGLNMVQTLSLIGL